MSRKYFGTDGVRGKVGHAPITPDFVLHLGAAAGRVLAGAGTEAHRPKVLIGKDTRISGYMLESALEAGFAAAVPAAREAGLAAVAVGCSHHFGVAGHAVEHEQQRVLGHRSDGGDALAVPHNVEKHGRDRHVVERLRLGHGSDHRMERLTFGHRTDTPGTAGHLHQLVVGRASGLARFGRGGGEPAEAAGLGRLVSGGSGPAEAGTTIRRNYEYFTSLRGSISKAVDSCSEMLGLRTSSRNLM